MTSPFSVVMPLWGGDDPERFAAAARSATTEQTLRPDALVLTIDGPIGPGLEAVVARIEDGELGPATILRYDEHRGLAPALQDALEHLRTPLAARADADDLCRPDRFARQIPLMDEQGIDILGSAMREFSDSVPPGEGPVRRRPLDHDEIVRYLPFHSPFHHPSVVLRRDVALAAGGYRDLPHLEDYWLWERMVLAGARCANLPEVLVDYRVDGDLFARRGGWGMLRSDLRLQRIFAADGVTTRARALRNLVARSAYRLMPGRLRRLGYRIVVESDLPGSARRLG